VVLLVTVNAAGEPISVTVEKSSHNRNLDRAAKDAAMKWRFNPGQRNGTNVGDVVRVPVEFKL
jgi:protein TonB